MYLSRENRKLQNGFLIWSLPAVKTCIGSTKMCRKHCYARRAEYGYRPNVLPCRNDNFRESKRKDFVKRMGICIEAELIQNEKFNGHFRVHESGDFYSQIYLNKWIDIANYFPKIKFMAFTKSFKLDFSKVPSNFEVIMSVFPDTKLEKVPLGFPKAYAGMRGENSVKCSGLCEGCLKCWNLSAMNKNVWCEIKKGGKHNGKILD